MPAAELEIITTNAADKVACLSFCTSSKTSGSILMDLKTLFKNSEIINLKIIFSLNIFISYNCV